ncbi:hypothetical protein QP028_03860 [Corynebacterium suedekumii]|nr:hypothetical protein QP028_03860 [Corynebacterium suedekumii]
MTRPGQVVPAHVIDAFQEEGIPEPAGHAWDNGWRVGSVAYSRSGGVATGWSAKLRTTLQVDGVRIARPVRSTDGRFVVAGWKASQWIQGDLARRVDETVGVALRLADALAGQPTPPEPEGEDPLRPRRPARLGGDRTGVPGHRRPCPGRSRGPAGLHRLPRHAGPGGDGPRPSAAPRPHGYTAALVIVDGLIAGAVDDAIVDRFRHLPDIDQLLLRAVAYRRHVNDLHPQSSSNARAHIRRVEDALVSRVADILEA